MQHAPHGIRPNVVRDQVVQPTQIADVFSALRCIDVVVSVSILANVDVCLLDFGNNTATACLDHPGYDVPELVADVEILAEFYILPCKSLDCTWRF